MNAPLPESIRKALESASLDDKYSLDHGRAFMSGVQALVRLPMLQRQRDLAAGLNTGGFITGYRAEIDRRKIGLGVLAFVRIDADRNTAAATRELEEAIRRIPEVISCHYISGSGTFELQVMATDLDAFSRFALDVLLNLPHVKDLHTSFSLGEVKSGGALPLGHLRGAVEAGAPGAR